MLLGAAGHRCFAELGMNFVELPHLAVGPPLLVAIASLSPIELRDVVETARRIELGGELVNEQLRCE